MNPAHTQLMDKLAVDFGINWRITGRRKPSTYIRPVLWSVGWVMQVPVSVHQVGPNDDIHKLIQELLSTSLGQI